MYLENISRVFHRNFTIVKRDIPLTDYFHNCDARLPELLVFLGLGHQVLLQLGLDGGELGLNLGQLLTVHGGILGFFFVAGVEIVVVGLESGELYSQVLPLLLKEKKMLF